MVIQVVQPRATATVLLVTARVLLVTAAMLLVTVTVKRGSPQVKGGGGGEGGFALVAQERFNGVYCTFWAYFQHDRRKRR